MRFLVVTPAACIHEHHQPDPQRKGEGHTDNQCSNSMPADAFECAEGIAASEQQHGKGQDDDDGLMEVGTFHFIRGQPSIIGKIAPEDWIGGIGKGGWGLSDAMRPLVENQSLRLMIVPSPA